APFSRKTLLLRPHDTTRRNRYRATSSGLSRRCPRSVQVTPYSFSRPKMRRSTSAVYGRGSQTPGRFAFRARLVDFATMPMTRLTSVHGSFGAHVIAARLVDEGFDVELQGAVDSPYVVTVGDLARVDVYVPDDQLDEA